MTNPNQQTAEEERLQAVLRKAAAVLEEALGHAAGGASRGEIREAITSLQGFIKLSPEERLMTSLCPFPRGSAIYDAWVLGWEASRANPPGTPPRK